MFTLLDLSLGGNGLLGGMKLTARHAGAHERHKLRPICQSPSSAWPPKSATGHEIWLSSGNLVTAMRASYALPACSSP